MSNQEKVYGGVQLCRLLHIASAVHKQYSLYPLVEINFLMRKYAITLEAASKIKKSTSLKYRELEFSAPTGP